MAHPIVVEKIVARLKEVWDGKVFDENQHWTTPTDRGADDRLKPFIEVQFPRSTSRMASIGAPGDNIWREEGGARIVLFYERGTGAELSRQWCEEIAQAFRGKNLGDGVLTQAVTSPIRDGSNAEGTLYRLAFAIAYTADIHG